MRNRSNITSIRTATTGARIAPRLLAVGVGAAVLLGGATPCLAGDADRDGFDDLAAGAYGEDGPGVPDAGMLHVLPGSANGPGSAGATLWTEDTPGVIDAAESGDAFGIRFVWGDFDGDGYDDLAVSATGEQVGGDEQAGVVHVFYGSAIGLRALGNAYFSGDSPGLIGSANAGDIFGLGLAAGDFDGDGYDDLALSAPLTDVLGSPDVGIVHFLPGGRDGLDDDGSSTISQATGGIIGDPNANEQFGATLAAGDYDGDGRDDLAIGTPGDVIGGRTNAGSVTFVYADFDNSVITQSTAGIHTTVTVGDRFGSRLAAGDFNHDGVDDLAVGVPDEDVAGRSASGMVHVVPGRRGTGPTGRGAHAFDQSTTGVHTRPAAGDRFGNALAAGDFDGNRYDDLAIGDGRAHV